MKCMFEELSRTGQHAAPPPTQRVYYVSLYLWSWPRWIAPVSAIMYHYSLRAATAGLSVIAPQTFQGRAFDEFVHFRCVVYLNLH